MQLIVFLLFIAAAFLDFFCAVYDGEVFYLLTGSTDTLEDYPIYHELSTLQIDVISTNNSPYPVSVEQLLNLTLYYVIVDILC